MKNIFGQFSDPIPQGRFHKVIALHDAPDADFEMISHRLPDSCRSWLELAQLPAADRLELTKEFWFHKMRSYPRLSQFLLKFFDTIDEIGIYLVQAHIDEPVECRMAYNLAHNRGYFCGQSPVSDAQIASVQNYFSDIILPADYLAFLQIHNGFSKTTDSTGIIAADQLVAHYDSLQMMLALRNTPIHCKEGIVNPKLLIPFYASFGMPFYQCFWGEWFPEGEMGNVYYSTATHTLTQPSTEADEADSMAFPTFSDWLIFYLEGI